MWLDIGSLSSSGKKGVTYAAEEVQQRNELSYLLVKGILFRAYKRDEFSLPLTCSQTRYQVGRKEGIDSSR